LIDVSAVSLQVDASAGERQFPESNVAKEKAALQKEWDEHLHSAHTRQWEREEKKRARRRAKMEQIIPKDEVTEGQ
jgi:hypothetical protein